MRYELGVYTMSKVKMNLNCQTKSNTACMIKRSVFIFGGLYYSNLQNYCNTFWPNPEPIDPHKEANSILKKIQKNENY